MLSAGWQKSFEQPVQLHAIATHIKPKMAARRAPCTMRCQDQEQALKSGTVSYSILWIFNGWGTTVPERVWVGMKAAFIANLLMQAAHADLPQDGQKEMWNKRRFWVYV